MAFATVTLLKKGIFMTKDRSIYIYA